MSERGRGHGKSSQGLFKVWRLRPMAREKGKEAKEGDSFLNTDRVCRARPFSRKYQSCNVFDDGGRRSSGTRLLGVRCTCQGV